LSYEGQLSDLEYNYPFVPGSRRFFEAIPIEEGLASGEVVRQAQDRLMDALGRLDQIPGGKYERHLSELTEFSSFFSAALVASQDGYLASKFSKREGERAKAIFVKERATQKGTVMQRCFGYGVALVDGQGSRSRYSMPVQDYLMLTSKFELGRVGRWKLARIPLEAGIVYMGDNLLNDFFGECAQRAVADGVRNLRKASFPRQLAEVKSRVMRYVPAPRVRPGKGYDYVEELLKHPVSDGRHRLVWMVLAPYLVNVKKLEDQEAIEKMRAFVAVGGETADMRRFIEYNVRRARRNGLMPPRFATMKAEHPDIYALLPKEVQLGEQKKQVPRPQQRK
jgi:Primase X